MMWTFWTKTPHFFYVLHIAIAVNFLFLIGTTSAIYGMAVQSELR